MVVGGNQIPMLRHTLQKKKNYKPRCLIIMLKLILKALCLVFKVNYERRYLISETLKKTEG